MNFSDFVANNRDVIRKHSDSVTPRKVNGVPVIAHNDEWKTESEWDELYKQLKDKRKN